MYRWYSRTYHTPLETAYELNKEDLMRIYFEDRYLEMREQDLEQEKSELLETEEERNERIAAEERAAFEADEFAQLVAEEEKKSSTSSSSEIKAQHDPGSPLAPAPPKNESMLGFVEKESNLPVPTKLPPDITMTFVSEEELREELEGFGKMSQPKKPK
ncbi:MAG: hypothetical protein EBZ49_06500 [Proteobacteria bacterium]|nr:hypothetical protein [Pseudomonadota bacterium]